MKLRGLGYIGINSTNPETWRTFGTEVLGLMDVPADGAPDGELRLRMDRHSWRIAVREGAADGLDYVGWETGGPADFEAAVAKVEATGAAVKRVEGAECQARGVHALARFDDPWGNTNEVFWGAAADEDEFRSPQGVSGFVTDGVGVGHVLYVVPSAWEAMKFYADALGFRLTDYFQWGPNAAIFMHTTPRHHSIAFVDLPLPGGPGLNHFMIEANTTVDVGRAYDRARAAGVPITNSLGQHSNDPMLSFYMIAPSGFAVEFGCNGLMIDEATWTVSEYHGRGELWGHTGELMDNIAAAKQE